VLKEKGLRNYGTYAASTEQPDHGGDQVDKKNGHRAGISVEVGELK